MVRRNAAEFPDLPSEIATEARRAADAQRTVALALAPSISDEEFEAYRQRILAEHDDSLIARMTALADRAIEDCAHAAQRARATTDLLRGCFDRAGVSSWTPSCVRGGK